VGSFGRHDEVVDANLGNKDYFATFTGSNSKSDNYKDGNGNEVYSKYHRYSASSSVGITPDNNKRFELSAGRSNGYAAYADRTMDGTKFLRENIAGKGQIKNVSDLVEKIDFQVSRSTIFHTMSEAMRGNPSSYMDVAHDTNAARITSDLNLRATTRAKVGFDYSQAKHGGNMPGMGAITITEDSEFKNASLFAEVAEQLSKNNKLIAGYRGDSWEVADKRSSGASTTSGQTRKEFTNSAFARVERALESVPNSTTYVGFGRSERMPDYWELISNKQNSSGASALMSTKTEKTNQLDLGLLHKSGPLDLSASAFYNKINDFILVDARSGYTSGMYGIPSSRNIDAHTYGAEVTSSYALSNVVKFNSSIAYVKGKNETDGLPLAQLAPLEGRLAIAYDDKKYSYGSLLRLAAQKDEVAVGQGNISGQDIAKSGGFGIFSLNAGYKPNKKTLIAAGIDNVFDKAFAEFISRAGASVAGYTQTTRVNEPGRTAWLKATIALD